MNNEMDLDLSLQNKKTHETLCLVRNVMLNNLDISVDKQRTKEDNPCKFAFQGFRFFLKLENKIPF